MVCIPVHQHGGWFGYVLNQRRRVLFVTGSMPTEFAARRAANLWMLKQQGRAQPIPQEPDYYTDDPYTRGRA